MLSLHSYVYADIVTEFVHNTHTAALGMHTCCGYDVLFDAVPSVC